MSERLYTTEATGLARFAVRMTDALIDALNAPAEEPVSPAA